MSTSQGLISQEDVQRVAVLARLRLEGGEVGQLTAQLAEILQYVQQLQALSTEGVEPTSHVLPLSNVMRPDQQAPVTDTETVLGQAPARHGQFFKVPKVLET